MTLRAQHDAFEFRKGFDPAVVTDNTAQVSEIIDTQGYNSLTFLIQTGTLADVDATFAVLVEHDDVVGFGTAAAVADTFLDPTEAVAGFTFAEDDDVRKIAYKGPKRFVRLTLTPSANSGNAPLACIAMLGRAHEAPIAGNA